eukprot:5624015-Prymnesium_polylepis.1
MLDEILVVLEGIDIVFVLGLHVGHGFKPRDRRDRRRGGRLAPHLGRRVVTTTVALWRALLRLRGASTHHALGSASGPQQGERLRRAAPVEATRGTLFSHLEVLDFNKSCSTRFQLT